MKNRARRYLETFSKTIALLVAVLAMSGCAGSDGDDSTSSTVTETTVLSANQNASSTIPDTTTPATEVTNSDEQSEVNNGDSTLNYLAILVLCLLIAGAAVFIVKGIREPKQKYVAKPGNSRSTNVQGFSAGTNSYKAQAPVQNRPKVSPGNLPKAGTAYPTQTPRVERETIELVSPVEAKTDSTITAEPEQTSARVRPNLVPIGIPETEETPNVLDEVSDRYIIKPHQIGDPSAFRKKNWWDPNVEWCQLSPLGMTSDITCDIGTFGSSAIAAASLRGNKHKLDAKPCQDAFNVQSALDKSGAKYVVSVLCDGMSSARYSHYGARRTSQVLSDALCRIIENSYIVDIEFVNANIEQVLESCRQMVLPKEIDLFGASGIDPNDVVDSDFNTTVTFLIAPSGPGESNSKAIVGCIGDSPIFVLHGAEGVWEQIGVIDLADELVNPATAAFPGSIAIAIDELELHKGDVLVAMSDGVGNFINVRGNQTLLGTYLAKQWSTPVNMATFVNDVSFDMKSADDDRTVIAIWQRT